MSKPISRRNFLRKLRDIGKGTFLTSLIPSIPFYLIYEFLISQAKKLPVKEKDSLAILISEPETLIEKFGSNFLKIYIARMELALGKKATIIKKAADSHDFFEVMLDKNIQDVCLLGHGSESYWVASSGTVYYFDFVFNLPKNLHKNGYLLKHTCGKKGVRIVEPKNFLTEEEFEEAKKRIKSINSNLIDKHIYFVIGDPFKLGNVSGDLYIGILPLNIELSQIETLHRHREFMNEKIYEFIFPFSFQKNKNPKLKEIKTLIDKKTSKKIEALFKYLNSKIIENIERLNASKKIFGMPVFDRDKIAEYHFISTPLDFILFPFGRDPTIIDNFLEPLFKFLRDRD